MQHIKKFIDKVSLNESRQAKDVVISISDARGLRDELTKLLADLHEITRNSPEEVIQVEVKGGRF